MLVQQIGHLQVSRAPLETHHRVAGGKQRVLAALDAVDGPDQIDAGELIEGENSLLDAHVAKRPVRVEIVIAEHVFQRRAQHDAHRDLRPGHAGGFADKGHCARSPRIGFEDIDAPAFDRELDIHQAADVELLGEQPRLPPDFIHDGLRKRVGG